MYYRKICEKIKKERMGNLKKEKPQSNRIEAKNRE